MEPGGSVGMEEGSMSVDGPRPDVSAGVTRREVLKMGGALAGAGAAMAALGSAITALAESARGELNEATIVDLQAAMASGELSALELVEFYLERIDSLDRHGPRV